MTHCIIAREYEGGVVAVDSGLLRAEMAACYLLESGQRVAIIETGIQASVERILHVLAQRGWQPGQVSHVIVTHVHLDHAGGAGALMQSLPEAVLVAHPYGARHVIDPSRLEASARAVYGDEVFEATYGRLVPVDASRVITMDDGASLNVGHRRLSFIDTPGHARHHFCVWDEQTRGWFSGDTFGVSYRDLDSAAGPFLFPSTTPTQFDPDALIRSVQRLMAQSPRFMYLTHFGRVAATDRLARQMIDGVNQYRALGEQYVHAQDRTGAIRNDMMSWLVDQIRPTGVRQTDQQLRSLLRDDVILNTQGVEYWLDHRTPT